MKGFTQKNSVGCGDWHLGWGFGGHNHIGKLKKEDGKFIWRGHQQGRHGQIYNRPANIVFTFDGVEISIIENDKNRSLPERDEVLKAIETLNRIESAK